jgi:tRNA U34 5-methylaminomethyl-2-thiouridine-forming methyltransferase MnmC
MIREFVLTEDGSHTIFVPEMGEHYHSVHGAIQESRHIFINHGYKKTDKAPLSILEVGFGTGLNALLTILEGIHDGRSVTYETWEAYPISLAESRLLNYPTILGSGHVLFDILHQCDWGKAQIINDLFTLTKVRDDIRNFYSDSLFDLVYFDAFGPDYQPELWEAGIFDKIATCMKSGARLVTYSAKGQVRRNLKAAGFLIQKAPGPPGKREITIAIKTEPCH